MPLGDTTLSCPNLGKIASQPCEDLHPSLIDGLFLNDQRIGVSHIIGASNYPLVVSQLVEHSLGIADRDIPYRLELAQE